MLDFYDRLDSNPTGTQYQSGDGEVVTILRQVENVTSNKGVTMPRFIASNGWRYSANGTFDADARHPKFDLVKRMVPVDWS